jgi:hypothetical protein
VLVGFALCEEGSSAALDRKWVGAKKAVVTAAGSAEPSGSGISNDGLVVINLEIRSDYDLTINKSF